ncbi:hypothetical protein [Methylobacterium sp. 77]|uniref:hypothetical protein n=1 Tax=Methylobacterium sp. 77 TaxID=1101192 RepID=UPI0003657053|nr:hypothetical protein [Methylobacterium sp. 77]
MKTMLVFDERHVDHDIHAANVDDSDGEDIAARGTGAEHIQCHDAIGCPKSLFGS